MLGEARYEVVSLFNGCFCVLVTDSGGHRRASPDLWTLEQAHKWIERLPDTAADASPVVHRASPVAARLIKG